MHETETPWSVWFSHSVPKTKKVRHSLTTKDDFLNELHKLCTLSSLEELFELWSRLSDVSLIENGSNLYFFRLGMRPLWEELPDGCTLSVNFPRECRSDLNNKWLHLILSNLGEVLTTTNLAGCSVNVRPRVITLSVWLTSIPSDEIAARLVSELRHILSLPMDTVVDFKEHRYMIQNPKPQRFSLPANTVANF